MDNIKKLIAKTKVKLISYYVINTVLKVFIILFSLVFINYLSDIFAISSQNLRSILWFLTLIFIIYLITKTILKTVQLKTADEYISLLIQEKNKNIKDDLIISVQLNKNTNPGTSQELSNAFIENTSSKISLNLMKNVVNFKNIKNAFFVFAVLLINFLLFLNQFTIKRYFLTFNSDTEFTVLPKDTTITAGSDVNIYVLTKTENSTPYIFYKEINGDWQQKKMKKTENKKYSEKIEKIMSDTEYYVTLLDNKSSKYNIKIVSPVSVSITKVEYIYPSYIGLPNKTETEGDIEAPKGTTIIISAEINRNIKEAFLLTDTNEKIKAGVSKNEITVQFVIQNQTEYWLEPALEAETITLPLKYKISISKNNAPSIDIIAPAMDVMISEDGRLKIVYSAEDDFGISEINIDYLALKKKMQVKSFSRPVKKILDEYEIIIPDLNLKPKDVIAYRLEVTDSGNFSEKLTSYSKTYSLEILSYELEHLLIEKEISEFNMALNEVLSRQLQSKTALTKQDLENASLMQKNAQELLNSSASDFKKTVNKMANDPFTSYPNYLEYKNLLDSANSIGNQKMNDAMNSLSNKQLDDANHIQDEIINDLKRLNAFSENITKNQKMEDMLSTTREMSDSADLIKEKLSDMKNMPDPEKLKELQKASDKLSDLISQLSEKLAKMPQETPKDFANNDKMKKIDLTEMKLATDEMKWSLEMGNIDKAIELAKKLSQQISDILNSVENSANSTNNDTYSELQSKVNESMGELDNIIQEQQKILTDTQKSDAKRIEKILTLQKELLKKLAEKQKRAITELSNSKIIIEKSTSTSPSIYNLYIQPEINMNSVLNEFTSQKVDKSRELLIQIIPELDNLSKYVNIIKASNLISTSKTTEEEILNELKNFSPDKNTIYNKDDFGQHKQLSENQKNNMQRTKTLKQKLSELSKQTLSLPSETLENISSSEKSMDSASGELTNSNLPPAVDFEKKALDELSNGKEALKNASEQMSQMAKSSGSRGGMGQPKIRTSGGGGYTGFRSGFVKIPSADDYKPPKEFRETIIESLRQKYPQKYDTIIKDYFKRLIE
ncbi:MAG: hypothetical protein A2539_10170 [Elusimicrobia bacterium RIFOXYD2_FULL_34_15]|nr:MAG: hypothetical protein A2539_10170 [Elusimicrobia bacterium RIFOXYD2_FULL_34_15]